MSDIGCFKSAESQKLFGLLFTGENQPIEKLKMIADKFIEIEDVPHKDPIFTLSIIGSLISTYLEYGITFKDRASIQKAKHYAQLGYDLCVKNDPKQLWFYDKYLGLAIFHGGSLGIKEVEKIEFHLGRYCSLDSSDEHANYALDMALKMKRQIMKSDLSRSSIPTATKKAGFFSKIFGK